MTVVYSMIFYILVLPVTVGGSPGQGVNFLAPLHKKRGGVDECYLAGFDSILHVHCRTDLPGTPGRKQKEVTAPVPQLSFTSFR